MKHPSRWDLPKGHVDKGETEMECALRELFEETGIGESDVEIDPEFRYDQRYKVKLAKFNHEPRPKTLTIFLGKLLDPDFEIIPTEHEGYQWVDWSPPHDIQKKTINPLLKAVEQYWQSVKANG
jgi:8-oxo-dGTP pyrophosphatase MutT (NUDIX family)